MQVTTRSTYNERNRANPHAESCTTTFLCVCGKVRQNSPNKHSILTEPVLQVFKQCIQILWNVLYENGSCGFHFITYNLNRYIFRNINAIGLLFLTWVYKILGEFITILSCVTRYITSWLIFPLTASSPTQSGHVTSAVITQ